MTQACVQKFGLKSAVSECSNGFAPVNNVSLFCAEIILILIDIHKLYDNI